MFFPPSSSSAGASPVDYPPSLTCVSTSKSSAPHHCALDMCCIDTSFTQQASTYMIKAATILNQQNVMLFGSFSDGPEALSTLVNPFEAQSADQPADNTTDQPTAKSIQCNLSQQTTLRTTLRATWSAPVRQTGQSPERIAPST